MGSMIQQYLETTQPIKSAGIIPILPVCCQQNTQLAIPKVSLRHFSVGFTVHAKEMIFLFDYCSKIKSTEKATSQKLTLQLHENSSSL